MQQIRIGRISAINYEKGRVRVLYKDKGDQVTAEIPLFCQEYYMPKVDDMVAVLHLPNGSAAGCVLGRMWSDQNLPPESGEGLYRKDLDRQPGTAMIRYDANEKELKIHCNGKIIITGDLKIEAKSIEIEVKGDSGDVTVNGVSLTQHRHPVSGDKTEPPEKE